MKHTYRPKSKGVQILALICALMLLSVFIIPVCTSCNDGVDDFTETVPSTTTPSTEAATVPTETEPDCSVKYNPELANTDLDYQLAHLLDTLDYNFTH